MAKLNDVPVPLNAQERLMYAQVVRLDAICDMLSSIVEVMANQNNIAVETKKVVEKKAPVKRKPRATTKTT